MKPEWVEKAWLEHCEKYRSNFAHYEAKAFAEALEHAAEADGFKLVGRRAIDLLNRMANMTDPRENTAGEDEELEAFWRCIQEAQAIADAAPEQPG